MRQEAIKMGAVFAARIESLHSMQSWIRQELSPLQLDSSLLKKIELAAEEVIVNIIQHASLGTGQTIEIVVNTYPQSHVELIFADLGAPFNPLALQKAHTDKSLEERQVGGLGIHLMKELMDDVQYQRVGNRNVLTLLKKITHSSQKK